VIDIDLEVGSDAPAIEALLDLSFGPGRHLKTCERLRQGRSPAEGLALVARRGTEVVGTLRFWGLDAGGVPALLLGPVAVHPRFRSLGIGAALIEGGLRRADRLGHHAVLLVGDPEYYERFGFRRAPTLRLEMPGPVEPRRFLGLELEPGALRAARGLVRAGGTPARHAVRRAA